MSDGGYFSALGARIEEMAAPVMAPPQPERLSMDVQDTGLAGPTIHTDHALENVVPAPSDTRLIAAPANEAVILPPVVTTDPAEPQTTEPAAPPVAPLLEPEKLRPERASEPTPERNAPLYATPDYTAHALDTPDKAASHVVPPPPATTEDPQPPNDPDASTDVAQPQELSPEDHLALFEAYLERLTNHNAPETQEPPSSAPQPAPHIEPAQAGPAEAPQRTLETPEQASHAPPPPRLNIGEIIVTIAEPAQAPAPPAAPTRRRAQTSPRRRFGHGLTAL